MPETVVIAGAGLVGALNACFFAQRGWEVHVYERREDIRQMEHVPGRSINLALSARGKAALDAVGLKDYIVQQGVEMHCRLIHGKSGKVESRQPYGQPGEHIVSINRRHLNETMLTRAEQFGSVHFHFEHKVLAVDRRRKTLVVERLSDKKTLQITADLIVAADGAHSAVRRSLMAYPGFEFSQTYIQHGYVELNILPKDGGGFALEPNVFHLWPRGEFTLIALANRDCTFTVTLFAPFALFKRELSDEKSVEHFFRTNFPDALELIGLDAVLERFRTTEPQWLVSIKCAPHQFDEFLVLTGDAAHAMVPFYGQGMNAGFEDCLLLDRALKDHKNDIPSALRSYSSSRCRDAHAINDLAMYNYEELKDLVNHLSYKLRKKFDLWLNRWLPNTWIPLYSMVTFRQIPYAEVVQIRKRQDKIVRSFLHASFFVGFAAIAGYAVVRTRSHF